MYSPPGNNTIPDAERSGPLLKKHYTGRRDIIAGLLLLAAALVVIRLLTSTGMPPFIAFLWTCWIFFWGVISLAQGAGNWFAARDEMRH